MTFRVMTIGIVQFLLLILQFTVANSDQVPLHEIPREQSTHRIAIIGAGAGGSSAAFHLAKFHNETNGVPQIDIDVFEASGRIGGRTTTVDALNDPRYPVEVGGSIFVTVNHILYNFTRDFELSTKEKIYESTGSAYDLGVWDGSAFVFTIANDDSPDGSWSGRWRGYWDIAKLLWKYGFSPIWTQRAKDNVVSRFLKMYDEYFPIASLTNFASEVGLTEYTGITGRAALLKNSVSESFSREIVQSSTRVNYAQNLENIHGLETMVCMAIEGAMSIDGGNWQIFDEAVKRSGANLHLNTSVTNVRKSPRGTYQLQTTNTTSTTQQLSESEYDTVILASPYQFANITFMPALPESTLPEKIDYVTLHVTLFTTPYRPSPKFFGLDSQDLVPDSILTTLPTSLESHPETNPNTPRGSDAVGPTKFWSLSTLRVLNPQSDPFPPSADLISASKLAHNTNNSLPSSQKQYLYKIFSPNPITASFLSTLFDFPLSTSTPSSMSTSDSISTLPPHLLPWSHTKTWQSYPYLPPRTTFPSLLLDTPFGPTHIQEFNAQTKATKDWRGAFGLYYTSGIESFISTMETSALMGRNVARIIVDGLDGLKDQRVEDGGGRGMGEGGGDDDDSAKRGEL